MSDIASLADTWRERAHVLDSQPHGPLAQPAAVAEAIALRKCADELSQAWHGHAHGASWQPGECKICRREMEADT